MSNYHIQEFGLNERNAKVIFHISIPLENNQVPVAGGGPIGLRTALSQYIKPLNSDGTFGTFQSQLQGIQAPELTQLQNGELYEISEIVKFLAQDNNATKQTKIESMFTELSIYYLNKIRTLLKFWGFNKDL